MTDPTLAVELFVVAAILIFGTIIVGVALSVRSSDVTGPAPDSPREGAAPELVDRAMRHPEESVTALPGVDGERPTATAKAAVPASRPIAS